VVTERFHRWDFHPLEYQLASLHRLFHPLLHAGLSRRTNIAITLKIPRLGYQSVSDTWGLAKVVRKIEFKLPHIRRLGESAGCNSSER